MPTSAQKNTDRTEARLFQLGRDVIGPAFTIFVFATIEECRRRGITDAYFLAREGLLFRRIYERLIESGIWDDKSGLPEAHYLCVSRLSTCAPAIHHFTELEVLFARESKPPRDVAGSLRMFGIDYADVADLHPEIAPTDSTRELDLLLLDPRLDERTRPQRELERGRLRRYLEQKGFFGAQGRRAIVDIGWSGTIQLNLTRAFGDDADFPELVGFYFGRCYWHERTIDEDVYSHWSRSTFEPGLFFDEQRSDWVERGIVYCVELFEIVAAAPHGTTLGYEERDGKVQPVFKPPPGDLAPGLAQLQAGVLESIPRLAAELRSRRTNVAALKRRASRRLARLLRRPRLDEARALGSLSHSIDWGSDAAQALVDDSLSMSLLLEPRKLLHALERTFWREGTLRLLRVPGTLWLLQWGRWSKWRWRELKRSRESTAPDDAPA